MTRIDYKQLRRITPQAARLAVLEYLKTNKGNVSDTATVFGINRPVVYDIPKKERGNDLSDRSRAPHYQPNKTSSFSSETRKPSPKNKSFTMCY